MSVLTLHHAPARADVVRGLIGAATEAGRTEEGSGTREGMGVGAGGGVMRSLARAHPSDNWHGVPYHEGEFHSFYVGTL